MTAIGLMKNHVTENTANFRKHQPDSHYFYRKEMRIMPWYTNHKITCKVLNRIANRYSRSSLQDLKSVLDHATETIWRKQEHYYNSLQQ